MNVTSSRPTAVTAPLASLATARPTQRRLTVDPTLAWAFEHRLMNDIEALRTSGPEFGRLQSLRRQVAPTPEVAPPDPPTGPLPTGVLARRFTYGVNRPFGKGGSHYYKTRTALPEGMTLEEANALLNRFNAPTRDGLAGRGNNPRDTWGTVVEPHTGLPSGLVHYERGVDEHGRAWVRNTTDPLHVFQGTITRRIEVRDGRYYVVTEGEGQGGALSNIRHKLNESFGPELFTDFDQRMIQAYLREREARRRAA